MLRETGRTKDLDKGNFKSLKVLKDKVVGAGNLAVVVESGNMDSCQKKYYNNK